MPTLLLGLALLAAGQTPAVPEGWRSSRLASGVVEYVPGDLKAGETFRISIFPPQPLGGVGILDWTKARIAGDAALPGKLSGAPKMEASSDTGGLFTQMSALPDGSVLAGLYTGMAVGTEGRLMRLTMSTQEGLYERYAAPTGAFMAALRAGVGEAKATPHKTAPEGAGTVAANAVYGKMLPQSLAEFRIGGPLKPGIYEGKRIYEGKNGFTTDMRLYLHDNGEYRILFKNEGGTQFGMPDLGDEGDYGYDAETGQIQIGRLFNLGNDRSNPMGKHTLVLTDPSGTPVVYGRDDRGFNFLRTILVYKGPVDQPSPTLAKQILAEREAAERRYKWITAPGKGLQAAQIHAVYHSLKVVSGGMGGAVSQNSVYVLLKDGTIYDGLPVPPDQFDASTARRREPERWGRWKTANGKVLVAWPDAPGKWSPLVGVPARPGGATTRLEGRYGTGSSFVGIGASSWALWGVTFKGNRFVKDSRGGSGNYSSAPLPGTLSVNTVYDDDTSSTSAMGDGIVVASSNKIDARRTRSGTYAVEGFTLVLKYDDGRVVRQPFFMSSNGKGVWFEGSYLTLDDVR